MIAINSDYFTPDFRLANTQSASTCGSLMMALSILLSAKYGGTHTAAMTLLDADAGSFTHPIGGVLEGIEFFDDVPNCSSLAVWELLPTGSISVLRIESLRPFNLTLADFCPGKDECLRFLDKLDEILDANGIGGADRQMILRCAVLELGIRSYDQGSAATSDDFASMVPTWWPEVVAYGRTLGITSHPQKPQRRGAVSLFDDDDLE
jgi:hypothetical protein